MIKQGISTLSHTQRRALLKQRLSQGQMVVAPGVFEMVSAKMADQMGFDALYMTGYGTVASYLGLPDAGIATYSDMVNRVTQFASITATPARVLGLADTGTLEVGKRADIVLWDGDPLELMSSPVAVWIDGAAQPMTSRQTLLAQRYKALGRIDLPLQYPR